jgi:16S rRNA (cytosine1402-N4)-methyltransferase
MKTSPPFDLSQSVKASEIGHFPVMLPEVMAAVSPKDGETIIDCTFGGGGYSRAFLDSANCNVIGLDRDITAIERAKDSFKEYSDRLKLINTPFSEVGNLGFQEIDAIVLDIGVSSFQIDNAERGFSFQKDGPLDMRMGEGISAEEVLLTHSEAEIAKIFWDYGEEKNSRRIARAIVHDRGENPYRTTKQLADLCERVYGHKKEKIHPATRVFQALRIYVNDELAELEKALESSIDILKDGGRLVVVTFHSLEDRIVKNFFVKHCTTPAVSRYHPQINAVKPKFLLPSKKPIIADDAETAINPRSRSAKLRYGIRTIS